MNSDGCNICRRECYCVLGPIHLKKGNIMSRQFELTVLAVAVMVSGGLGACSSQHLVVERLRSGQSVEGYSYALPRTELQLRFTLVAEALDRKSTRLNSSH